MRFTLRTLLLSVTLWAVTIGFIAFAMVNPDAALTTIFVFSLGLLWLAGLVQMFSVSVSTEEHEERASARLGMIFLVALDVLTFGVALALLPASTDRTIKEGHGKWIVLALIAIAVVSIAIGIALTRPALN